MLVNIAKERNLLKLSNSMLAERLGISKEMLRKWISCQEAIPARKLVELSQIFGDCSVDYLLMRNDKR